MAVRVLGVGSSRLYAAINRAPFQLKGLNEIWRRNISQSLTIPQPSIISNFPILNTIANTAFSLIQNSVSLVISDIFSGIMMIKRTFQPSLIRMKRKHGFLARQQTKDGRKVLNRRKNKGRRRLCA